MDFSALINRRISTAMAAIRRPFRVALSRVTTKGGVMTAQFDGLEGETQPDMEVFQQYGLTSTPPAGAMAIAIPLGGKTSHSIIIATEHSQYRVQELQPGEVAIYDNIGQSVTLTADGIVVNGAGKPITFTNGEYLRVEMPIKCTADIIDNCDGSGETMAQMRITYNGHTHIENGDGGGVTDKPTQQMN